MSGGEGDESLPATPDRARILGRANLLLPERRFWQVIGASVPAGDWSESAQVELLEAGLDELSREELTGFCGHFWLKHAGAYRNDLWAVAYTVLGGCSDDCFADFRSWLVGCGEDRYERALRQPDSLCDAFREIPDGEIPLLEFFLHVPFDRRFGEGSCDQAYAAFGFGPEQLLDPEHAWSHEDEGSLSALCPGVFREFWGNERF